MDNKRLGCLTGSAIITASISVLIIFGLIFAKGGAIFSPGDLNAQTGQSLNGVSAHAEIGNNCAKCHPAPWSAETLSDRCLICHTNISSQLADQQSLHASMMKVSKLPCQACHTDHRGPTAALTNMNLLTFPHENLGFSLQAHQQRNVGQAFTCSDCHASDISTFEQGTCRNCHEQIDQVFMAEHILVYASDCQSCHDGVESISKNFDHGRMNFKLDGKHNGVACVKCHLDAHSTADLKATPVDCVACHQKDDEHQGGFGQDCGVCHQASGWKPATFDHNLSAFKLDGKHTNVACDQCHFNNVFKGTATDCAACHIDPDYHAGMFPGQACSACHSTAAWKPAPYNGPHTFPINHGEKNNTCADCHQPTLRQWTCYTCHDQAEMAQKHQEERISNFDDCLRCHPTGQDEEGGGGD